jgi:hypothetical protein
LFSSRQPAIPKTGRPSTISAVADLAAGENGDAYPEIEINPDEADYGYPIGAD